MQCKQAHEYAHIKCNQSKFMSLLPLLVCFSCPRILILLNSSMLLPLCPCPCPTSTSLSQFLPKLSYLCTISPPLSSISIKGELLIDANVYVRGRWLRLESCIFYGHHLIVGMTPLVDTTLVGLLEIPHIGSLILIPICGTPPPMSYHGSSIC